MNPNRELIRRRFSLGARHYDASTPIQRRMAADLLAQVPTTLVPRRILEIGCGTGHLTELLCRRYPEAEIRATDLSEAMLGRAAQRLAERPGLSFAVADADALAADGDLAAADLVIGSAVLQWLPEPVTTVRRFAERLPAGGIAAFATFGPGTLAELQALLAEIEVTHPLARLPDLADWRDGLADFSFDARSDVAVDWAADGRSLLREISRIGGGLPHAGLAFAQMRRLLVKYDASAEADGVRASWQRIFVMIRGQG